MIIVTNEYGQRVLIPSGNKWLLAVEELEFSEEERNYIQAAYIANVLMLTDCEHMYIEVERDNNVDN